MNELPGSSAPTGRPTSAQDNALGNAENAVSPEGAPQSTAESAGQNSGKKTCPNCARDIVDGAQVYQCGACDKDCCTCCTESIAGFDVICDQCLSGLRRERDQLKAELCTCHENWQAAMGVVSTLEGMLADAKAEVERLRISRSGVLHAERMASLHGQLVQAQQERDLLLATAEAANKQVAVLLTELATERAENAELLKDKARLDHIEKRLTNSALGALSSSGALRVRGAHSLRGAIDAALATHAPAPVPEGPSEISRAAQAPGSTPQTDHVPEGQRTEGSQS